MSPPIVSVRNLDIWRRRLRGERLTALGREFDICPARVRQIFVNVDRKVRRALNKITPNAEPYVYDTWFHFETGNPLIRIEP